MALVLYNYLLNLWPFRAFRFDELKLSDSLVRKLSIPEQTKQFIFATYEPENEAVIYILCAQNLSEQSARDTECLIREVQPDAVIVQVGSPTLSEIQSQEIEFEDGIDDDLVPTSAFRVLMRCFLDKTCKEKYEDLAGNLVLKEIFGVGFYGHFLVAKRTAEEVGSSFLMLESSFTKSGGDGTDPLCEADGGDSNKFQALGLQPTSLAPQNMGPTVSSTLKRSFVANDIQSQMVKLLCPSLVESLTKLNPSMEVGSGDIQPRCDYQPPPFAQSVYPLLVDLHDIFSDIPSIGRALAYAQKMFNDVDKGKVVESKILSEVYTFQIAVEGLRVALNNAGKLPLSKMENTRPGKIEFSDLSVEEKSNCILAQALRSQTRKFKTIVAIVDASGLADIRKYWNTPVPPEVSDTVDELVMSHQFDTDGSKDEEMKWPLMSKPVVTVGAGATAVLGASSLSKVVPISTIAKIVTINVPASLKIFLAQTHKATAIAFSKILGSSKVMAPGFASSGTKASTAFKAAASAEKIRAVTHSVIASAEKTSFSAMRTAFYEIMRKRQVKTIGFMPWATFGCSIATCTGLLVYGDGIECVAESLPAAPSIASLGRGIRSLQEASQAVKESRGSTIQNAIESLMHRFKNVKIQ